MKAKQARLMYPTPRHSQSDRSGPASRTVQVLTQCIAFEATDGQDTKYMSLVNDSCIYNTWLAWSVQSMCTPKHAAQGRLTPGGKHGNSAYNCQLEPN